jgi:BlaR1 peptidase M56
MQSLVLYYLLQAAVLLLVGTLLYCLLFWRSTFLRWNRVLLWSILLATLILPFVHLPESWTLQGWQNKVTTSPSTPRLNVSEKLPEPQFFSEINLSEQETPSGTSEVISTMRPIVPITRLLLFFYGIGFFVFGIRFLIHLFSLFKLFRKAHLEQRDGYYLAFCQEELSPFAFGRTIFLSEALLQSEDFELILTHELEHVRQRHTLDILAAELLLVWQWFNPGAWLYRRLVETNLEYLADRSVLHQQWDKKQYQLSLLNWSNANASNRLSTSYNFSLLKERIMMMNRKPASKVYLLGYAVVLALLPMLSVFNQPAFVQSATINSDQALKLPLDQKKVSPGLSLEADESVQAPIIEARQINTSSKRPEQIPIVSTTEPGEPKPDSSDFFIVVGPNATETEMEKLSKIRFSYGKQLILNRSAENKLVGYTIQGAIAACGNSIPTGKDDLPSIVYSKKMSCGSANYLRLNTLDEILAADWSKTKIYCIGLPTTKQAIAALRPRALALFEAEEAQKLARLKAVNWVYTYDYGHQSYGSSEKALNLLKNKVQKCIEGNLELIVTINGGAPQNTLPALENLKLTQIKACDRKTDYYQENTTKLLKEEITGFKVQIFTEE